jgi:ATP-dependent Clp protease ATP-binding subunit ClpA
MQHNPEIEHIIEQAVSIARVEKHEFVITEHLLLALIQYDPFRKCLDRFGVEVSQMEQEIVNYLSSLRSITKTEDHQP